MTREDKYTRDVKGYEGLYKVNALGEVFSVKRNKMLKGFTLKGWCDMEREEAIKILKAIRVYECYPKSASEETNEALDMAIEALHREEAEEKGYCHRIIPKGERREP